MKNISNILLILLVVLVSGFSAIVILNIFTLPKARISAARHPVKETAAIPEPKITDQPKTETTETLPISASQPKAEAPQADLAKPTEDQALKVKINSLIAKINSNNVEESLKAEDELVRLGRKAVVIIGEMLKASDEPLRGELAFILGRIKDKEATPFLIEALNDENAYIRRNTVEALGKVRDKESIPVLIGRLADEDSTVREKSAWALGESRDSLAIGELLNRLNDQEENDEVKTAVVEALSKIKDRSVTGDLVRQLKLDVDQGYKNEVVNALGEIADPLSEPELSDYLDNLRQDAPGDQSLLLSWQGDVQIAEEALMKIRGRI